MSKRTRRASRTEYEEDRVLLTIASAAQEDDFAIEAAEHELDSVESAFPAPKKGVVPQGNPEMVLSSSNSRMLANMHQVFFFTDSQPIDALIYDTKGEVVTLKLPFVQWHEKPKQLKLTIETIP